MVRMDKYSERTSLVTTSSIGIVDISGEKQMLFHFKKKKIKKIFMKTE
jgi:hypothetical protein